MLLYMQSLPIHLNEYYSFELFKVYINEQVFNVSVFLSSFKF